MLYTRETVELCALCVNSSVGFRVFYYTRFSGGSSLGIPASDAITMFYKQIVMRRGIPFDVKLATYEAPLAYGSLTKEQFDEEMEKP